MSFKRSIVGCWGEAGAQVSLSWVKPAVGDETRRGSDGKRSREKAQWLGIEASFFSISGVELTIQGKKN